MRLVVPLPGLGHDDHRHPEQPGEHGDLDRHVDDEHVRPDPLHPGSDRGSPRPKSRVPQGHPVQTTPSGDIVTVRVHPFVVHRQLDPPELRTGIAEPRADEGDLVPATGEDRPDDGRPGEVAGAGVMDVPPDLHAQPTRIVLTLASPSSSSAKTSRYSRTIRS